MTDDDRARRRPRWTARWRSRGSAERRRDPAPRRRPPPDPQHLRPRGRRGQGQRPAHGRAGRDADPRGHRRPRHARRRRRAPGHPRRPPDQRGPAQGDGDDRRHHRDPEPGRPRPALPAHARPRRATSWSGWATTRRPSRSRRASSRRMPPLENYVDLPRLGERVAELVHGIIRALVDVDEVKAREVAALDDEVDDLYHAIFDEVLGLMREDPTNVEPGTRILFAVALPRADRRPGHEHRRGHRVPRLGRGRGPQPLTSRPAPRSASSSCAPATARARSWRRRCSATSAASRIEVYSAGIEPTGVNPLTLRVLEEAGLRDRRASRPSPSTTTSASSSTT